jgi:electron transfer flavoprotein alpha subunit
VKEIFCLAEHRSDELRDVTLELLGEATDLAEKLDAEVSAVLLGHDITSFAQELSSHAKRVLVVEDEKLTDFNQAVYQKVLYHLIHEHKPVLTLIGHTAFGMDLAPSLAVETDLPLATDCIDLEVEEGELFAVRQMYGGKVNARVSFPGARQYMVTVRQGAFPAANGESKGEILTIPCPLTEEIKNKKFVRYVEAEAGEVDITQADVIVSVGRGIKKKENMPIVEELADCLGGVVACSRPVVDLDWLSKDRQVGQSGKTVKPKLYLAVGISGAFQHVVAMRGSETIIAINKDANAPIFSIADYGIVDDLSEVVPALSAKIKEVKSE